MSPDFNLRLAKRKNINSIHGSAPARPINFCNALKHNNIKNHSSVNKIPKSGKNSGHLHGGYITEPGGYLIAQGRQHQAYPGGVQVFYVGLLVLQGAAQ